MLKLKGEFTIITKTVWFMEFEALSRISCIVIGCPSINDAYIKHDMNTGTLPVSQWRIEYTEGNKLFKGVCYQRYALRLDNSTETYGSAAPHARRDIRMESHRKPFQTVAVAGEIQNNHIGLCLRFLCCELTASN